MGWSAVDFGQFRAAGVSHDSPRAQTCTFQGFGLHEHHQNSTKGEKNENCGGRGKTKSEILGVQRRVQGSGFIFFSPLGCLLVEFWVAFQKRRDLEMSAFGVFGLSAVRGKKGGPGGLLGGVSEDQTPFSPPFLTPPPPF